MIATGRVTVRRRATSHIVACRGMQIGRRKIQSSDDSSAYVPPDGSEHDTWMQAYTRRLLLERYNTHMLWLNAQRSFRPECMDGAQGSNCSKTNPMRGTPNDREKRTRPLSERDSLIRIYHPVFSSNNYECIVSLELAMQVVFDHAKSQLPEAIAKRVLERWQFRGHGDNNNAPRPATVCFPFGYAGESPAPNDVWQRGQACPTLVSRAALTSVGSKMKGGRRLCVVYMCAFVYRYTHSHCTWVTEREEKHQKARESHIERERGYTCEGCERLDMRVMGRVCVRVLHKSCLIHFD